MNLIQSLYTVFIVTETTFEMKESKRKTCNQWNWKHFYALLIKRLHHTRRSKKAIFAEVQNNIYYYNYKHHLRCFVLSNVCVGTWHTKIGFEY